MSVMLNYLLTRWKHRILCHWKFSYVNYDGW